MTTTRTPVRRATKSRITPQVIALFKRMEELATQCTCPPTDWVTPDAYWKDSGEDCPACTEWWDLHERLHDLLDLPISQWPAAGRLARPRICRVCECAVRNSADRKGEKTLSSC
jgi:hypothetical protein